MAIPSVVQGLIETEGGKVFELDSPKGAAWLESISSFRFEPAGDAKPCTIRKEASGYWYGCRKVAGKVRKKYIGKSSEISTAKLEEIAAALEVPPAQRVNKVVEEVAQVAEVAKVAQVAEVAQDRLTALELEVANLRKSLEALQESLRGKLESGNSLELPKVDNEVAEQLQNELRNLKDENEALRQELAKEKENYGALVIISQQLNQQLEGVEADRAKLLESSTHVTNKLRQEVQELRSQLETERADREEVEAELSDLKQKSVTTSKLPGAADLLNQLKAKRKKSSASLADVELIFEMIEES
jgi:chromosome segregation ATPase